MVTVPGKALGSPWWIAARMVVYSVSFLALVLWLLPTGFNWLGRAAGLSHAADVVFDALGRARPLVGAALFVIGVGSYAVGSLWLVVVGKGPFVEFDPPREFVASGPYRWTRNPVAISLIVAVLGEAVYLASAGILLLVLLGLVFAHYQVTRIEEPRLKQRFGQPYEDYCRRVPRWLPRRPAD